MAVKGSGQLSMVNDIVAEFGGDAPHAMSEYYGGAGRVPAGANPNVPASGQIRFNNFYNSVAATVLNITSSTNNYNIATAAVAAGGDLNTPVILTIASGVTVGSTSTSNPAMTTGTGWGAGTTVNITNNGSIVGASGSNGTGGVGAGGRGANATNGNFPSGQAGGNGGNGSAGSGSAGAAQQGGDAYNHADANLSTIFDTAGTRTGGSAGYLSFQGGGGGGGGGGPSFNNGWSWQAGGGGGGGAGSPAGRGGSPYYNAQGGGNGTLNQGGSGGRGIYSTPWDANYGPGNGGNGGGRGGSGGVGQHGQHTGKRPGSGPYRTLNNRGSAGSGAGGSQSYGSAGSALSGITGNIS